MGAFRLRLVAIAVVVVIAGVLGGCGFVGANGQEDWLTSVPQEGASSSDDRTAAPNRCNEVSWARDQVDIGMNQADVAAALGTPDEVAGDEDAPEWIWNLGNCTFDYEWWTLTFGDGVLVSEQISRG